MAEAAQMNGKTLRPRAPAQSGRVRQLEIGLTKLEGAQGSHEKVCAERYLRIDTALIKLDETITKIDAKLDEVATAQTTSAGVAKGAADARRPKWWVGPVTTIMAVIMAGVIGLVSWMASRLVADNDQRIADAKNHPAAVSTVTVNPPSAAAPATPP